ncbi:hypothetical protein RJ639_000511 [Escallonia herrerae]|uniref:Uncharacterized protein n=1 Tax=Escallonia herrerae TaxID=1293975 RepID=A0AA88XC05_9ASTE|nr:hypothetical protein RJ639_000511 [Escallonia herrerae]
MSAEKMDTQRYCHFHKDHGYTTEECKEKLPPTDSRLRPDQRCLENGKYKMANAEKLQREQRQRQMGILEDRVNPIFSALYGFTGASAPINKITSLTVIVGDTLVQATRTIDFLIVKVKSSYNGILGRAGLNKLQVVALTYHLVMKFPTPNGVGIVRGDQTLARKYVTSCKAEKTLTIDDQQDEQTIKRAEQTLKRAEPVETLISLPLIKGDEERQLQIGSTLKPVLHDQLIIFLLSNIDVFAWSKVDMPGIDTSVIIHRLSIDPNTEWSAYARKDSSQVPRGRQVKDDKRSSCREESRKAATQRLFFFFGSVCPRIS